MSAEETPAPGDARAQADDDTHDDTDDADGTDDADDTVRDADPDTDRDEHDDADDGTKTDGTDAGTTTSTDAEPGDTDDTASPDDTDDADDAPPPDDTDESASTPEHTPEFLSAYRSALGETGEADDATAPDDTDEPASAPEHTPEFLSAYRSALGEHDEPGDATKPRIVPPDGEPGEAGDDTGASGASEEHRELEEHREPGEETAPARGVRPAAAVPGRPKGAPGGKKPAKPKKQTDRRIKYARRAAYVLGVLVLLPVIGFVVVYLMTPIPSSAQPAAKAEQSVFYYSDGKSIIARTGEFDRRPVELGEVPRQVRDAVISAENRSFYSDPGVSLRGSARAAWATLTGGSMQGGSTITQQMVRNYYSGLSQQRTASRKLKEIMIALKVSREKDKDWILQQYLNTIYFGRDAYGIQSASQAYYDKDVDKLTPAEAAYLAAAIQVPTYAGDLSVPGAQAYMQARWQYVVGGMVQMRTISPQEAAAMRFPTPAKEKQKSIFAGDKGYMVSQAKAELRRMGYTDNQINMGGLKIRTTFDKDLMAAARQAVQDNIPAGTSKKVLTGLVSINPSNGEINAFYGGKDYLDRQFNSAFDDKVQAGSGFKPYVLAAALSHGEDLTTYVDGSSPQTFAGTALQNDRNENFGMVNLVTATQDSINTAYINLGQKVGLDKVVATAEKAGIPAAQLEAQKEGDSYPPTLPLGVADVSVEQQAAGYATFASEGIYHTPHVIKSVSDHDGKARRPDLPPGKRAFSQTVARDATYAMQKVVDAGTGTNAGLPDRNAAGKTGTTSKGKQLWFNGFIPQLAASVGIFRSDNKPLSIPGYSAYGGDLPARIWRAYMVQADQVLDLPPKSFGAPSVYTGGSSRPSTAPVNPRPHPTGSRPAPPPTIPTHPIPPPTPEPPPTTGPPTQGPPPTGGPQRHTRRYPDLYG